MKNEKGFTLVEGLLVALVLAIIGFGAFNVWTNNQDDDATSQITQKVTDKDVSESGQNSTEETDTENTFKPPSDWNKNNNQKLGISYYIPANWSEKKYESVVESEDSVFMAWTSNDVEIRLSAASVEDCPQGDGSPLHLYQGYFEEDGVYYANWCPEESYNKGDSKIKVGEDGSVDSVSLGKVLYKSSESECNNFWCDEGQISSGAKVSSFSSVFNTDTPPFAGGTFYYTHVGDANDVSQVKKDLMDVLRSLESI